QDFPFISTCKFIFLQKKSTSFYTSSNLKSKKNVGKLVALDTTKNLCNGKSLEDIFIQLTN
ncbi:MAG: hypothetical protein IJS29_07650, partial [Selenomonadaceae bacterium]|nr:hypothetical protein [Selenomonadaceae bacterium]